MAVVLLLGEEGHVVVAGDLDRTGDAHVDLDVAGKCAVDEALLWGTLQPDAGVDGAFDQDGAVEAGHGVNVAGEDGEGGVPGFLPCGIGGGKLRTGRTILRRRCGALGRFGPRGILQKMRRCGGAGGKHGVVDEASASRAAGHGQQCTGVQRAGEAVRTIGETIGDQPDTMKASHAEDLAEIGALNPATFRRRLMGWYRLHARALPWRATSDPYRIWVSEIMLQQTRVAAVVEHYEEFLRRFPTLVALSLATESEVLAAWSGLGYYRRARMLHKAAQFIVTERGGVLPTTSAELRTLPGIGEYTGAAIASIVFGESIAVVDGNVERVLLRLFGRSEEKGAGMRTFVRQQAQELMPESRIIEAAAAVGVTATGGQGMWTTHERLAIAAAAFPEQPAGEGSYRVVAGVLDEIGPEMDEDAPGNHNGADPGAKQLRANPAGDHNQAMMELGATICLPRAPLCLHCPVYTMCQTRGEHVTAPRAAQLSRPAAYLLETRKSGTATEVLLERRAAEASLMPGMYELPPLPLDAVEGREPALRLRHAITGTNYYVQVFAASAKPAGKASRAAGAQLRKAVPSRACDLLWVRTSRLGLLPLTGLARKVLHRLKVMEGPSIELLK